ncbi:hypothetical protein [Brachybacterium sp. GPGPB12]|uniref:hypothetical protein n=1 Tax=Brachybacterium sp. GPGPB12 TaxID=3023517 RepID=UPI0031342EE6
MAASWEVCPEAWPVIDFVTNAANTRLSEISDPVRDLTTISMVEAAATNTAPASWY